MDITRQDINKITFQDVVDFCQQKVIENLFLDYKKNKPKDLSKHIAGFSNASGGLIIIGVEEDTNGLPKEWKGIENVDKPTDWAHQMANNVIPMPSYEAAVTDEVDGKVFLLVRILQGDSAPYVTKSDPTVWVRTGNVRTKIEPANREDLAQLVDRSAKADSIRIHENDSLKFRFKQLEAHKIEELKRTGKTQTSKAEADRSLLSISVMPFNPVNKIVDIKELSQLSELWTKFSPGSSNLATLASNATPMINGLAALRFVRDDGIQALQIKDTGTLGYMCDVATLNGANHKSIYVQHILRYLMDILLPASLLYRSYEFNGLVRLHIQLSNVQGANIYRISMGSHDFGDDDLYAISHTYTWDYQFTTAELNDKESFISGVSDLIEDIHWDLGDQGIGKDNLRTLLEKYRWDTYGL